MKRRYGRLLIAFSLLGLLLLSGCHQDPDAVFKALGQAPNVDPRLGVVPWAVTFDASDSYASRNIIRYTWDFGDDSEASGFLIQHTFMHAGDYTVRLTVEDAQGRQDSSTMLIHVSPAVWITDAAMNKVFKLNMSGELINEFSTLPYTDPHGITVGVANRETWVYVLCANDGNPRLLRFDPATGEIVSERFGVSLEPLFLAYSDLGASGQRLWHIDGFTKKLYLLDPISETIWDEYSAGRLVGVPPAITDEPILSDPQGLACTWNDGIPYLWYMEGSTKKLYRIKMTLRGGGPNELVWDIQLNIELPSTMVADLSVFPLGGMDIYKEEAWLIDLEMHRIVRMDLETGEITGIAMPNLPGSNTSGLDIQH